MIPGPTSWACGQAGTTGITTGSHGEPQPRRGHGPRPHLIRIPRPSPAPAGLLGPPVAPRAGTARSRLTSELYLSRRTAHRGRRDPASPSARDLVDHLTVTRASSQSFIRVPSESQAALRPPAGRRAQAQASGRARPLPFKFALPRLSVRVSPTSRLSRRGRHPVLRQLSRFHSCPASLPGL
jgi:hypothetical protein